MERIKGINRRIKEEAARIVDFYNTNDPVAIAEYLGILVLKSDLGNVSGFLQYYSNYYIIHINENIEDERALDRVIAHELGHYFLHKNLNIFKMSLSTIAFTGKIEQEADTFACELLLPDKILEEEAIYIENMNHKELAVYFNIDPNIVGLKYYHSTIAHFFDKQRTYVRIFEVILWQ
ncbi:ImmA/IrrE family metallo-endopeptidase [Enterococcus sp. BWR-S5]|uniref:ImmA/IrrE family metallo-endopeptidase n=1 Tax=Enterococcus sp. BWR-S5 TaxID=2787714 RepID=UPI001923FE0E|nr:ImmA/IrrE family metallo-endopeptidase [Enterococcus sp. BWR-S5]